MMTTVTPGTAVPDRLRIFPCFALSLLLLALTPAHASDVFVGSAIRKIIVTAEHPRIKWSHVSDCAEYLDRFYSSSNFAPAWFDNGLPRAHAAQILEVLQGAESHGLDSSDYDLAWLRERIQSVGTSVAPQDVAEIDTALSIAVFRYISDVGTGRIDPRSVHFQIDLAPKKRDLAKLMRDAVAADRLPQVLAEAAPRLPIYHELRTALSRYRALARDVSLKPLPVVRKLQTGMPYAGLAELHGLLSALGDLSPAAPVASRYEGEIVAGVKRFQARHGLAADGVIGKATFAQLNTPMTDRVRQIELGLERLRWLPETDADRIVLVNIPEFRLHAFELSGGQTVRVFGMKVIVGKALDTQTPVFYEDMRLIEFNPFWNIPPSIARGETIPKLRRDPGYLARASMEFVGAGGISSEVTASNLDAVLRGGMRIRQRPGPRNALGAIKFVLPNRMNIYLHHTPSVRLFNRERRDFSHGCIRLEEPVKLARFVLANQPEWSEERIMAAIAAGKHATVGLKEPVPVLIFYTTAITDNDGRVYFLADIYGHDRRLDEALRASRAYSR